MPKSRSSRTADAPGPGLPRLERRRLAELKPFPAQPDFFDDTSEYELRQLADDIQRNGLRHPIEVLPEGNKAGHPADTIIIGHRRRAALLLNGENTTDVLVRFDLKTADVWAVERIFLEDNNNRRHHDPLIKARVALRLFEIEKKKPRGKLWIGESAEARDRVGKATGMSGRNLNRYFLVLKAPLAVQNAFRAGKLPLVVAGKVALLGAGDQAETAARIAAGEDPKGVVADHVETSDGRHQTVGRALTRFLSGLRKGVDDLDGRLGEVPARLAALHAEDQAQARVVIEELIARAVGPQDQEPTFEQAAAAIGEQLARARRHAPPPAAVREAAGPEGSEPMGTE